MSIYTTPLSQLKTSDLDELMQEQAVENTRLEFKREVPNKDETLKKLSSFANTFGGFIVIGAAAQSKDGRIEELGGVDEVPGYKQKIADWCFKECSPPILVDVSAPIPTPKNDLKVCYVISVEQSEVAPHFLNGRKGIWIRTNEFSGKYDFALADENELRHLLNRRQLTMERRRSIVERARKRFGIHVSTTPSSLGNTTPSGAWFELCIVPSFPARQICNQEELSGLVRRAHYPTYRGVGFPRLHMGITTQHESALIRQPLTDVSLFEANVWGMVFYVAQLDEKEYTKHLSGIHAYSFVGHLLLFLQHANDMFKLTGLTGSILVEASLHAIRDCKWVFALPEFPSQGATKQISGLDDVFGLSVATTVENLREKPDDVAIELLRSIFFSLNWSDLVDSHAKLEVLIRQGHIYNRA